MKIAIVADVHGNLRGLQAVLADIESEKPDAILGAGDQVGCSPFPHSVQVWRTLQELGIPCVMGNQEASISSLYNSFGRGAPSSVQFMPQEYVARQFSPGDILAMQALPMTLTVEGPDGHSLCICHGSPSHLTRSLQEIPEELSEMDATVIAGGHLHKPWQQVWQSKLLVMAGSAGLPFQEKLNEVEYLLLAYRDHRWQVQHKRVAYDGQAAIQEVLQSDFISHGGPIGWLMVDEVLTQQDHLIPFFRAYCPPALPDDWRGWEVLAAGYLDKIGRWEIMRDHLARHGLYPMKG